MRRHPRKAAEGSAKPRGRPRERHQDFRAYCCSEEGRRREGGGREEGGSREGGGERRRREKEARGGGKRRKDEVLVGGTEKATSRIVTLGRASFKKGQVVWIMKIIYHMWYLIFVTQEE